MNCKKIHTIDLIPYLRGEMPENESRKIQQHLDECPAGRSFLSYTNEVLSGIQAEKALEDDPFLATRVIGHLQESSIAATYQPLRARLIPTLVLGLFILAGLIGGFGIGRVLTENQAHNKITTDMSSLMISDLHEEPMETFFLGN